VLVRSDSRLLVEQLSGRFRVKNPTLQRLHKQVRDLAGSFRDVAYEHVPREDNRQADRLANEGVDAWLAEEGASWRPPEASPKLWGSDPSAP
jgi:probable phosphoglycerate mutase